MGKAGLIFSIIIFLIFAPNFYSQRIKWEYFNNRSNWRANKLEFQLGFCASQFNGDVGGGPGKGIDYSTKDIDWESTGKGIQGAFKYRFSKYVATKTELSYFQLLGSDRYSEELIRNSRNLSFKSNCFEFSQRFEFIFLAQEFNGRFYQLAERARRRKSNFQLYAFGGLGFLHFTPKASYNGAYVALQPLCTEGQKTPYSTNTFIMPSGFGLRIGLSKQIRLGIEASYVKTFSDYLDDVSTFYADPSTLSNPAAAYLSNPSLGSVLFLPGDKRGDLNQKDAYYRLSFSIIFNLKHR